MSPRTGRDLGARSVSSSRELRIIGLMQALVSLSASILVSIPLCLNSNTSLSMYFFYNSRTHVITLHSGHICNVLCSNALVLTTSMDLG
jgi:hypothetical protein